jgi:glycosyltransferase involved in cell wall biosynthesis
MNLLFLSEQFYPHGGGAELATHLYADLLSRKGFNVVVVTNRFVGEKESSKTGNLTIYRLPLFKNESMKYSMLERLDVLLLSGMRKLMRWADVVYIPRFWYPAILLAKTYHKPVITHLHDYIPICPLAIFYDSSKHAFCSLNSPLCSGRCIYVFEKTRGKAFTGTLKSVALNSTVGRYFGKMVRLSDAIVCVSKAQRNIILERFPALGKKTCVVYNPLPQLSNIEIEGDDFGYFGGPNRRKGFHTLCQALMHIGRDNLHGIRIRGTKFSNLSTRFAEALSNLGLLPYGKLNNEEYDRLYKQIRSVIVPSIWSEPWPYVVVEAIIRGRFIIASNIGGMPEQVEGCKGALLVESGNHEQLAEAILHVKSLKKEAINEMGITNKETFLKRFNNETTINKFQNLCEDLV